MICLQVTLSVCVSYPISNACMGVSVKIGTREEVGCCSHIYDWCTREESRLLLIYMIGAPVKKSVVAHIYMIGAPVKKVGCCLYQEVWCARFLCYAYSKLTCMRCVMFYSMQIVLRTWHLSERPSC